MSERMSSDTPSEEVSEGKKYAVVVSTNVSAKTPYLHALKYAESDAQGISYLLGQRDSGFLSPYPALIGRGASTQNVRETIVELIKQKNKGDLLLFYFIGHGYLAAAGDKAVDTYLVTADFNPEPVEYDPSAHLSLSWLRDMLFEKNRAADVIIILDCCYGGSISKPLTPEEQFVQSFKAFAESVQAKEGLQKHTERSWAILTSAEANVLAHEEIDSSGQGHVRMTGLILAALSGRNRKALDGESGDLTPQSLHSHLEREMRSAGSQYPPMMSDLRRRMVLAHLPLLETGSHQSITQRKILISDTEYFDRTICRDATLGDLNVEEVEAFFQKERVLRSYSLGSERTTQMEEMGMLCQGHPSYGTLLCLGKHPKTQIEGAITRCIHRRGNKGPSGWHNDKECKRNLLQQFMEACEFVKTSLSAYNLSFEEDTVEPGMFPFRAFQEALANALIHREYVSRSDNMPRAQQVKVEIFSNRVEISSHGAPPDPMKVEFLKEILEEGRINPHLGGHPRNPQIWWIFYLAGHVERSGSGINRIQQLMEDADLPVQISLTPTQTLIMTLYLPRPIRNA